MSKYFLEAEVVISVAEWKANGNLDSGWEELSKKIRPLFDRIGRQFFPDKHNEDDWIALQPRIQKTLERLDCTKYYIFTTVSVIIYRYLADKSQP